jgi:tetratricopeptide (TPR) repeat protein
MCSGHVEGDGYRSAADQTADTPPHLLDLRLRPLIACHCGYCAYMGACPAGSRTWTSAILSLLVIVVEVKRRPASSGHRKGALMTRGKPDPVAAFAARLRAFREEVGEPPLNRLVELTEGTAWPLARSTISDKLAGKSVVSWEFVSSFVTACVTHARSSGRSLPAELTELGEWDKAHAEMLDTMAADRTQALQAKAARSERARRDARASSPQPPCTASSVLPRAALAGMHGWKSEEVFVGRDAKLAELREVLEGSHETAGASTAVIYAAVAGMAGVGKTALAKRGANQSAEAFSGGVLFIDLQGYDLSRMVSPEAALVRLLRALGVAAEHIEPGLDERHELYLACLEKLALEQKPVLVLLDNASSAGQVRPLLPPGTGPHRAVVTSRQALAAGLNARAIKLGVLDTGEALELMDRVLRVVSPADDRITRSPEHARELARLCGHLPLALKITVALLAASPGLTLAALARTFAEASGPDRLDVLDDGDSMAVRRAFDLSYNHASEPQRRMFRLLSLNPGQDISAAAAAALAGMKASAARHLIWQLCASHLVESPPRNEQGNRKDEDEERYRFHDLLALYARERADEDENAAERDAAIGRLLDYYLGAAREADQRLDHEPGECGPASRFASRQEALRWFEREHASLVGAVALAHDTGYYAHARDLPRAIMAYLVQRGHWNEWGTTHELALSAARHLKDLRGEGIAADRLGLAYCALRRLPEAAEYHKRAAEIARQLDDLRGEGRSLGNLGAVYLEMGQTDEAISCHLQDLEIARKLDDTYGQAQAMNNLGAVYAHLGQPDQLDPHYRRSLEIFRSRSDLEGESLANANMGLAYLRSGEPDSAVPYYERAAELRRTIGEPKWLAKAIDHLGAAYCDANRFHEGIACHREAADLYREAESKHGEGLAMDGLGTALRGAGQPEDAIAAHRRAIEAFQDARERLGEGCAWANLGQAQKALRRISDARDSLEHAIAIFEEIRSPSESDQARKWLEDLREDPLSPARVSCHARCRDRNCAHCPSPETRRVAAGCVAFTVAPCGPDRRRSRRTGGCPASVSQVQGGRTDD